MESKADSAGGKGKLKNLVSAVRTIFEFRRKLFPTPGTTARRFGMKKICLVTPAFVKHSTATVTFQKRLSAFDGNQGDEKKA